jgi:hypothetical protein
VNTNGPHFPGGDRATVVETPEITCSVYIPAGLLLFTLSMACQPDRGDV